MALSINPVSVTKIESVLTGYKHPLKLCILLSLSHLRDLPIMSSLLISMQKLWSGMALPSKDIVP
jgi:hypothetical protein